jgi:hypothetical protein
VEKMKNENQWRKKEMEEEGGVGTGHWALGDAELKKA